MEHQRTAEEGAFKVWMHNMVLLDKILDFLGKDSDWVILLPNRIQRLPQQFVIILHFLKRKRNIICWKMQIGTH